MAAATASATAQPLPAYGVDPARVTVSGISSGGYMAVQLAVAHSSVFRGVGVFAAGPYACAETGGGGAANVNRALGPCMAGAYSWTQRWWCLWGWASCPGSEGPDAQAGIALARSHEAQQRIDPLSNLATQGIVILSGAKDQTVVAKVVEELGRFYAAFVPATQIRKLRWAGVAHTFPTEDFKGGNACGVSEPPFISDCDMDGAREVLAHLHGAPQDAPAAVGVIAEFDQRAFVPPGGDAAMADRGYVFIPRACTASARCGLHVALHGCRQSVEDIGRKFVEGTGYNRWAAAHRLIVLYPQARKTGANPRGCWDWWGYTGTGWNDKRGLQVRAILAMVQRLRDGG